MLWIFSKNNTGNRKGQNDLPRIHQHYQNVLNVEGGGKEKNP